MDRAPRSGTQSSTVEGLIAAMAVVAILYFGRAVFVPLALAILLSFVLNPAAMLLRRLWFGRVASALTVILLAACLVLGLGAVVTQQISGLATSLPRYEDALSQKIKGLESAGWLSRVFGPASETLQHLGREIQQGREAKPGRRPPPPAPASPCPSRSASPNGSAGAGIDRSWKRCPSRFPPPPSWPCFWCSSCCSGMICATG